MTHSGIMLSLSDASLAKGAYPTTAAYDPQPQSPFLSLPCEIRLEIYNNLLVLISSSTTDKIRTLAGRNHVSSYVLPGVATPQDAPLHPEILTACKQCHTEAEPILYTRNVFTAHPTLLTAFPSLPPLQKSLTSPRVIALIRRWHVQVRLDTDPRFSVEAVATAFNDCDELEVECWQAVYGAADPGAVLGRFAAVRGVKKCVVSGSLGKDWIVRMERSLMRKEADYDWGVVERDMFGGGQHYDLWTHGNR